MAGRGALGGSASVEWRRRDNSSPPGDGADGRSGQHTHDSNDRSRGSADVLCTPGGVHRRRLHGRSRDLRAARRRRPGGRCRGLDLPASSLGPSTGCRSTPSPSRAPGTVGERVPGVRRPRMASRPLHRCHRICADLLRLPRFRGHHVHARDLPDPRRQRPKAVYWRWGSGLGEQMATVGRSHRWWDAGSVWAPGTFVTPGRPGHCRGRGAATPGAVGARAWPPMIPTVVRADGPRSSRGTCRPGDASRSLLCAHQHLIWPGR